MFIGTLIVVSRKYPILLCIRFAKIRKQGKFKGSPVVSKCFAYVTENVYKNTVCKVAEIMYIYKKESNKNPTIFIISFIRDGQSLSHKV